MSNIVAIVGRPNVGKSTFFNRLTESRSAIVDSFSGVTRDRHYGKAYWTGKEFSIIDTGGYVVGSDDIFEEQIRRHVKIAIEEANVLLFLVDVIDGVTPLDKEVADVLRRSKKKIFLVANKCDNSQRMAEAGMFYELGLGEVYPISSINGSGTGEILDALVASFTDDNVKEEEEENEIPKIAIVGRPNVGKSSLVNALTEDERNIVTPIAGTTRDAISTRYNKFGFDFELVDTAGIRRKNKVSEDIEFYSVMRSIRAIENSDVCVLLIDATEGIQAQDLAIFSIVEKNRRGAVILVNKWDLVEKDTNSMREYEEILRKRLAPFTDIPIIFGSALTKQRILKVLEEAIRVNQNRRRKIPTHKLNEDLQPIIEAYPPPMHKDKRIKVKFITQLPIYTPAFVFFCNLPQYVKDPYKRFIENKIRGLYDYTGVPIQIFFRQK